MNYNQLSCSSTCMFLCKKCKNYPGKLSKMAILQEVASSEKFLRAQFSEICKNFNIYENYNIFYIPMIGGTHQFQIFYIKKWVSELRLYFNFGKSDIQRRAPSALNFKFKEKKSAWMIISIQNQHPRSGALINFNFFICKMCLWT